MTLYLVKVSPGLGRRIEAEPDLLLQVWGETDVIDAAVGALDQDGDMLMENYLHLSQMLQERQGSYPWMEAALHGTGSVIAFEYGYGPGF